MKTSRILVALLDTQMQQIGSTTILPSICELLIRKQNFEILFSWVSNMLHPIRGKVNPVAGVQGKLGNGHNKATDHDNDSRNKEIVELCAS